MAVGRAIRHGFAGRTLTVTAEQTGRGAVDRACLGLFERSADHVAARTTIRRAVLRLRLALGTSAIAAFAAVSRAADKALELTAVTVAASVTVPGT